MLQIALSPSSLPKRGKGARPRCPLPPVPRRRSRCWHLERSRNRMDKVRDLAANPYPLLPRFRRIARDADFDFLNDFGFIAEQGPMAGCGARLI